MPSKKWTYETCREVASRFRTLKDFRCAYPSAYTVAKKNNWIDGYTWMSVCKNAGYWDYDKCYAEAQKYETVSDFAHGNGSAHFRAKENGWIKDYHWFVDGKVLSAQKRTKWDYDACYQLASECRKKSELKFKNQRAYDVALKNGWFKDYTWFLSDEEIRHQKRPSRVKWSYEKCREEALKFKTLADFSKAFPSAYTIANRNGWIDDFDWLFRTGNIYEAKVDSVYAYFFRDLNSVYVGRTVEPSARDFGHNTSEKSSVYRFASENDVPIPKMTILESGLTILEGLDKEDYYRDKFQNDGWNILNVAKTGRKSGSLGGLGSGKWNYRSCYQEAQKFKTLKEFRRKSPAAYNVVCKNGWQNDYGWLKTIQHKPGYWTYERCYEQAQKYKTRKQFQSGSGSAYDKALKERWLDDYVWFAPSATNFRWDFDKCYEEAKKYTKLADFIKYGGGAYNVARKNDWVKRFTWLAKKDISKKTVLQYSMDGKLIAKYNGVREACRLNGFKSNSGISQCCNGKLNSHQGFVWKYEDE